MSHTASHRITVLQTKLLFISGEKYFRIASLGNGHTLTTSVKIWLTKSTDNLTPVNRERYEPKLDGNDYIPCFKPTEPTSDDR